MNSQRLFAVALCMLAVGVLLWWCSEQPQSPDGSGGSGVAPPVQPLGRGERAPEPLLLLVMPTLDDRVVHEPCNNVLSGGALRAGRSMTQMSKEVASLGVLMGDATQTFGHAGRRIALHYYRDLIGGLPVTVGCVGEGELGLGAEFVRTFLRGARSEDEFSLICANAVDAQGESILRGWLLASHPAQNVLFVAVAAERLQAEITARGSDVKLVNAEASVGQALADAERDAAEVGARINSRVLLVHGTVDETRALLRVFSQFDLAVAAEGPTTALPQPLQEAGIPILHVGSGWRFIGRAELQESSDDWPHLTVVRVGLRADPDTSRVPEQMRPFLTDLMPAYFAESLNDGARPPAPHGGLVGAATCTQCHAEQGREHAKSPHARMHADLEADTDFLMISPGCVSCHTTAPWYTGGYVGTRPGDDRAGVSCEVCHGFGGDHAAAPTPGWGRVEFDSCLKCHLPDRSPGFDPREEWAQWGHGKVGK